MQANTVTLHESDGERAITFTYVTTLSIAIITTQYLFLSMISLDYRHIGFRIKSTNVGSRVNIICFMISNFLFQFRIFVIVFLYCVSHP